MQLIILYQTADVSYKSFVIVDGPEGNIGKRCLRRYIASLAPDQQSSINKGLIIKSRYGQNYKSAQNEISNLRNGIRIGFTDELTREDLLDVRSIKKNQGVKKMAMRKNYEDTQRGWPHDCYLQISRNIIPA